jgi:tetratricopeptide (TPR) repeat protein
MAYLILASSLVLAGAAACGSDKSNSEKAGDALSAALQAHVEGRIDDAVTGYNEVLKFDPRNKYAFYNLGLIQQTNGNLPEADNDYRLAIHTDPDYVVALFNLAVVRTTLNDNAGGIELYRHVIALQPDYAFAHLNLGLALRKTGQGGEGDAEVAKGLQLDPTLAQKVPAAVGGSPVAETTPATPAAGSGATGTPTAAR